jgi:predicted outer membrane repeat protein
MRTLLVSLFGLALSTAAHAVLFTITSGNDSGAGTLRAAIVAANANSTADQLQFQGPSEVVLLSPLPTITGGTAIFSTSALVTIRRATNSSSVFRIFDVDTPAPVNFSKLRIQNGGAVNGAGLRISAVSAVGVNSCEFISNIADGSGGAIYVAPQDQGTNTALAVRDSTFVNNRAFTGGAVANMQNRVSILNSTFSGNTLSRVNSQSVGGAVYSDGLNFTITRLVNNTFAGNDAPAFSAVISSLFVANNIFQGEAPQVQIGTQLSGGGNLSSDAAGMNVLTDLRNLNARLGPLANIGGSTQTLGIGAGSPAIDIGIDTTISPYNLLTDQRGDSFPRLQGSKVDSGAIEAGLSPCSYTTSVNTISVPPAGLPNQEIALITQGSCNWTLSGIAPWTNGLSSTGTGTKYFALTIPANNTGAPRSTVLNFGPGATIAIAQIALPVNAVVRNLNNAGPDSLREAINRTSNAPSSSITIEPGVTGVINLFTPLPALGNVSISGPGANTLQIRHADGAPNFPILVIPSGVNTEVSGLALVGGVSTGQASGLVNLGTLTATGLHIRDGLGRGVFNAPGAKLTVRNSAITGNGDVTGAALLNQGELFLVNSTLSGNGVTIGAGGSLVNDGAGAFGYMINVTVAGNFTANAPNHAVINSGFLLVLGNSILANPGSMAQLVSAGFPGGALTTSNNLSTDASLPSSNFNLLSTDPQMGPLQNNGGATPTMALTNTSPARDKGDSGFIDATFFGAAPFFDQRGIGFARISGATVDIGAYEIQPTVADAILRNGFE